MLLELHILQNFAPSCLNRDDLNAPKDCEFGGKRRSRISSQCFKRATRWNEDFRTQLEHGIGTRTKFLLNELVEYLAKQGKSREDAEKAAEPVASAIGSGVNPEDGRTAIALYLGRDEIERIGAAVLARFNDLLAAAGESPAEEEEEPAAKTRGKKKAKKGSGSDAAKEIAAQIAKTFQPGTKAADIALFGRMIAEATNFNVDAAAQVAHCISTHEVPSEFDFFTAVDDLQPEGDSGAGMMGSQQFNSATFYRYANVHLPQLGRNLGNDAQLARVAALAFARSFVTAIPSAKQNSHAAQNPPDFVFAVVRREGQPLSLANAFAKPVQKYQRRNDGRDDDGLVGRSGKALADYWQRITRAYLSDSIAVASYFTVPVELDECDLPGATRVDGMKDFLAAISSALEQWSPEES